MSAVETIGCRVGEDFTDFLLPLPDAGPECVVDDPQGVMIIVDDPLTFLVAAGDAALGLGVLTILSPVSDDTADVGGVVENAGTATDVSADRGVAPFSPAWSGRPAR